MNTTNTKGALVALLGTQVWFQRHEVEAILAAALQAHSPPAPAVALPLELSADDIRAIRNSVEGPKGYTEGIIRKAFAWGVETARSQPASETAAGAAELVNKWCRRGMCTYSDHKHESGCGRATPPAATKVPSDSAEPAEVNAARYLRLRRHAGQIGAMLWRHAPWTHESAEENQARLDLCIDEEIADALAAGGDKEPS